MDIVKLGVRFLPEKPEGRFYVAKNRLYSHHLSFLCDKPGKQLPCLHEQIFAGQAQRAAKQRAVRYRSNREAEPKRLDKPGKQLPCLHEQIFAGQVQRAAKQRAVRYRSNREAEPKRLDKPGKQLPCLHEQIFAGQVQRAAEQQAVRIAVIARRNRKDQIRSFIEK